MVSYIDRLARTPADVWQIHDYKTNVDLTQAEKDAVSTRVLRKWNPLDVAHVERIELVWHFDAV
jgi:hypothetical protein